jgi:hypothetical protein
MRKLVFVLVFLVGQASSAQPDARTHSPRPLRLEDSTARSFVELSLGFMAGQTDKGESTLADTFFLVPAIAGQVAFGDFSFRLTLTTGLGNGYHPTESSAGSPVLHANYNKCFGQEWTTCLGLSNAVSVNLFTGSSDASVLVVSGSGFLQEYIYYVNDGFAFRSMLTAGVSNGTWVFRTQVGYGLSEPEGRRYGLSRGHMLLYGAGLGMKIGEYLVPSLEMNGFSFLNDINIMDWYEYSGGMTSFLFLNIGMRIELSRGSIVVYMAVPLVTPSDEINTGLGATLGYTWLFGE